MEPADDRGEEEFRAGTMKKKRMWGANRRGKK